MLERVYTVLWLRSRADIGGLPEKEEGEDRLELHGD